MHALMRTGHEKDGRAVEKDSHHLRNILHCDLAIAGIPAVGFSARTRSSGWLSRASWPFLLWLVGAVAANDRLLQCSSAVHDLLRESA